MFIPLYDGVPLTRVRRANVTYVLIAFTVVIFAITGGFWPRETVGAATAMGFGTIPSVVLGSQYLPDGLLAAPAPLTLVTSMFLHVSWLHLIGNMLFLWVFGDNVEDELGHMRFLLFYIVCGVAGGLAHTLANPESVQPLVGASGAISGVVGAYLVLFPRVKLWALFLAGIPLRVPVYWALGFWIVIQIVNAVTLVDTSTGWFAHLGGLAAGILVILLVRTRSTPPLFPLR
jgi:membrane associated rhomboid family serine protease